jgi:UDP-N-acetylmuramate--alanine ligase
MHYPHNRLWCIFQPHTYTRTKKLFNEFTEAFDGGRFSYTADIYAAREKDMEISARKCWQKQFLKRLELHLYA